MKNANATTTFWLILPVISLLVSASKQADSPPKCPAPCLCGGHVVVCACSNNAEPSTTITLESFEGIDYVQQVYIHSCRKLRIAANTFRRLSIEQELSIFNIGQLVLEPLAFQEMQKYPNQITIKDSRIEQIGAETFAGVNNADHLWFRNTTIGSIKSNAFTQVSDLQYLYFFETIIGSIETAAFSGIDGIANLFIRGNVKIGRMEKLAFKDARIGSLMLADADIGQSHSYALAGFTEISNIEMNNVTIGSTLAEEVIDPGSHMKLLVRNVEEQSPLQQVSKRHAVGTTGKDGQQSKESSSSEEKNIRERSRNVQTTIEIKHSRMAEFCVHPYTIAHEIRIDHSVIDNIVQCTADYYNSYAAQRGIPHHEQSQHKQQSSGQHNKHQPQQLVELGRLRKIHIVNSRIANISRYAFCNASPGLQDIVFERTSITNIDTGAFARTYNVHQLFLLNCRVETVHRHAFYNASLTSFSADGSSLSEIASGAFSDANLVLFNVVNSRMMNVSTESHAGLAVADSYVIQNTYIQNVRARAFAGLVAGRVNISQSILFTVEETIEQQPVLGGLIAKELSLETNKMSCSCSPTFLQLYRLEQESQDPTSPIHGTLNLQNNECLIGSANQSTTFRLYFEKCLENTKQLHTEQPAAMIANEFQCIQRNLILDCSCNKKHKYYNSKNSIINSDDDLLFPTSNSSIVIIRGCRNRLKITKHTITGNVGTLKITDSNLMIKPGAFRGLEKLQQLELIGVNINDVESGSMSFSGSKILNVIFRDSTIGTLHSDAFHNCQIERLHFDQSKIDTIRPRFISRSSIRRIKITECEIKQILNSAFGHTQGLHRLDIIKNNIEFLQKDSVPPANIAQKQRTTQNSVTVHGSSIEKMKLSTIFYSQKPVICFYTNSLGCPCSLEMALNLERTSRLTCADHFMNPEFQKTSHRDPNVCLSPTILQNRVIEDAYGYQLYHNYSCLDNNESALSKAANVYLLHLTPHIKILTVHIVILYLWSLHIF